MRLSRRAALASALVLSMPLIACQQTVATAPAGSGVNQADLEFVTNAYNLVEFDIAECTLAQTNAKDPRVRALAADLLAQANAFRDKARPAAIAAGITPPSVLRTDLRVRLGHMRLEQGLDFDRTFLEDQIASHTDALNQSEAMAAAPPGQGLTPSVQRFADGTHQQVSDNLAKLRAVQRQVLLNQ